jgi:hypothetical protein
MQSDVAIFSSPSLFESGSQKSSEARPSGFFESSQVLSAASLAAAVVLAVHRGLVPECEREHLPLRVTG